ncbi:SDR family NAD(P)-dependent oxidoreductase [Streptomyces phaeochromogenes]|uniref:SDR family NAD(P)-dependent oxidoreductase n=1 Tax=Streptomyces phaeochromogenes TaxID=1923 RepID=UPI00367B1D82
MTGERLRGKVALISGSTRGIGRSVAEHFAAEGARVMVAGRTVDRGEKVVARIREAGGEAAFQYLDIADERCVREAVEATVERYGELHTLVNNAAPTGVVARTVKPMHEYTTAEWDAIVRDTLTGSVFWTTKYAWPHLVAASGASVINVSSGQSVEGFKGFSAYGAAKGAVNSLTRTLAVEGSADGIRANCLIVGRVVALRGDSGLHTGGGRLTRIGHPMDIAYAATWLASDEATFVIGATVTVDGGFSVNGDAASDAERSLA